MTWRENWALALEYLHLGLKDWLIYLDKTQHMDNLWVESGDFESFRPHNTAYKDGEEMGKWFPHYRLSDAVILWMALSQLEQLIVLIEAGFSSRPERQPANIESMMGEVRRTYQSFQVTLSLPKLQSKIIGTFQVAKPQRSAALIASEKDSRSPNVATFHESQTISAQPSETTMIRSRVSRFGDTAGTASAVAETKSVFTFQRTIYEYDLKVQPTDFAVLEASFLGVFESEESHSQLAAAWQETLKLQNDDVSSLQDPRQVAMALFALRFGCRLVRSSEGKIEDVLHEKLISALYDSGIFASTIYNNAPGSTRRWTGATYESTSLLLGSLYEECRQYL